MRMCKRIVFVIGALVSIFLCLSVDRTFSVTNNKVVRRSLMETRERRLKSLKLACQMHSKYVSSQRHFIKGFVEDKRKHLSYCHVPKAASTFWLAVFGREVNLDRLNSIKTNDSSSGDFHRIMLTNSTSEPSDKSFKFVFVRHPLSRLVSAYINKFVDKMDRKFLNPLLRYMKRKSKDPIDTETVISFPDFVDFVIDEWKRNAMSHGSLHWIPQFKLCGMCQNK